MLAPLDNESIFKKSFTDKVVFQQFVKELFDVDIVVDKSETEKRFELPLSPINFELDIHAESIDHSFVVEIQKIDYDENFDRFLHYFLTLITKQQKSSADQKSKQTVLGVVVFARPLRFSQKDNQPVRDNVMVIDFNPRNLKGEMVNEHSMVFLNPSKKYQNSDNPMNFQDWLDLFYASMKEPVNYWLNQDNNGIAKAIRLIDYDLLDPFVLQKMKEAEMRKEMVFLNKLEGRLEAKLENAMNGIKAGFSNKVISAVTKLPNEEIDKLRNRPEK